MSKQITIRDDIYKELSEIKQGNQSYSDIISMMLDFCKKKKMKGISIEQTAEIQK